MFVVVELVQVQQLVVVQIVVEVLEQMIEKVEERRRIEEEEQMEKMKMVEEHQSVEEVDHRLNLHLEVLLVVVASLVDHPSFHRRHRHSS